ncbi:MAG: ATP-binding cassette domain-containing protein [Gorillibacterium sp.]|nr:ATP-binding cassette domain-containing protein [Gorillibacterium sp.]
MLLALIVVSNLVIIFTKAASSAARINEVLATVPSISDLGNQAGGIAGAGVHSTAKANAEPVAPVHSAASANPEQVAPVHSAEKANVEQVAPVHSATSTNVEQVTPVHSATSANAEPVAPESYASPFHAIPISLATVSIRFDHVSFGYSPTGERALTDVSVEMNHGETVGVIGSTGAGKTTFINLIPRFYDTTEGEVWVEGINVKDYLLPHLRQKIAIVPQKAVLFTGTIAENIRWGNEHATDEEITKAAATAQAEEFITKLPEGMNTMVSRGGRNLSGGQKQRLTIARAVVAKPAILILDDSSSALDFVTDAALRRALQESSEEMTVIIVSQRVSSIKQADKIIVFEEGRIVGVGTHEELIISCEVYKEVCLSQLVGEVTSA